MDDVTEAPSLVFQQWCGTMSRQQQENNDNIDNNYNKYPLVHIRRYGRMPVQGAGRRQMAAAFAASPLGAAENRKGHGMEGREGGRER